MRILEGSYPDVTNAGLNYWPLIRNGTVMPMDAYLDQPNWEGDMTWRESFLPGSLDAFKYEGKVYAIPFMYSVYAVWYNKTMFEERGWEIPTTWEEFFALCDRMRAENIWPLAFQGRYPNYSQSVIEHSYYQLAGPEGYAAMKLLEPGSFANPAMVQSFELTQRTSLDYFQPGAMGMSHTESQLEFFLGHTAMIFCGSWLKSEMLGKIPDGFRLGTFNLPIAMPALAPENTIRAGSGYYFVLKDLLEKYPSSIQIVYPVHPNPHVKDRAYDLLRSVENIILTDPMEYLPFVHLLNRADLILTDSGAIQEEAPSLGVPVLVLRESTERPEGVEAGTLKVVGTDRRRIVEEVSVLLDNPDEYETMARSKNPYGDGRASERIVDLI